MVAYARFPSFLTEEAPPLEAATKNGVEGVVLDSAEDPAFPTLNPSRAPVIAPIRETAEKKGGKVPYLDAHPAPPVGETGSEEQEPPRGEYRERTYPAPPSRDEAVGGGDGDGEEALPRGVKAPNDNGEFKIKVCGGPCTSLFPFLFNGLTWLSASPMPDGRRSATESAAHAAHCPSCVDQVKAPKAVVTDAPADEEIREPVRSLSTVYLPQPVVPASCSDACVACSPMQRLVTGGGKPATLRSAPPPAAVGARPRRGAARAAAPNVREAI